VVVMSRRHLLDLMTAAGLADKDLALERSKGERQAAGTAAWLSALNTGVNAAGNVATTGLKAVDDDAAARAANAVARNAYDTGDAALTPDEVAESNLAGDKELAAPEKTGDGFGDFVSDPFGLVTGARERAARKARGQLASQVGGLRKEAASKDRAEKLATEKMSTESRARAAALAAEDRRRAEDAAIRAKEREEDRSWDGTKHKDSREDKAKDRASQERAAALSATRLAEKADKDDEKSVRDGADGLRKEFNSQPAVKAFNEVKISYEKMKKAAEKPSAAGDLALIFSMMKMLDPGSTVREGEFATAQNAAGVPERMRARWNQTLDGEVLTEDQRRDFMGQADSFYTSQKSAHDDEVKRYADIATKRGIAIDDVLGPGAATDAKAARLAARASELKRAGHSKEQIREVLTAEGLLP
jgi:hypothetical protein